MSDIKLNSIPIETHVLYSVSHFTEFGKKLCFPRHTHSTFLTYLNSLESFILVILYEHKTDYPAYAHQGYFRTSMSQLQVLINSQDRSQSSMSHEHRSSTQRLLSYHYLYVVRGGTQNILDWCRHLYSSSGSAKHRSQQAKL
jgi:hypothetical protein